jgi:NAD(P)-dependent dehydrogenase (short-subunit alcohol dehydrogenase family)
LISLDGKTALVTGAASGIGRAIVLKFGQLGARIVAIDLQNMAELERLASESGITVSCVRADVAKSDDTAGAVAHTISTFGALDALVNCAGIVVRKSVLDTTEEEWDRVLAVNLKGVFLLCKAAIPMLGLTRGTIINIASDRGLFGTVDRAAYAASKAGVVQLTKSMAVDHASLGIRVNCICPGHIATPLLNEGLSMLGDLSQAQRAARDETLLKRMGTPEEVADVTAFLASEASSYMTGAIVLVDGGMHA